MAGTQFAQIPQMTGTPIATIRGSESRRDDVATNAVVEDAFIFP